MYVLYSTVTLFRHSATVPLQYSSYSTVVVVESCSTPYPGRGPKTSALQSTVQCSKSWW